MLKHLFRSTSAANISLVLVGLMFLLPFVIMHHDLPIPLFYSEWIAGTPGLLAIVPLFCAASWQNRTSIKIPHISLVFVGLTVILCAQWAFGMLHSAQYALLVLSYLAWAFLLTILGSYLQRELGWEKLVTTLAWGLVIGGLINVGIVTLQLVTRTGGIIPWLPNVMNFGAVSQANHFANFTALATTSLIYLFIKGRFSVSSFTLALLSFLMMLSLSGSRSAWLYLSALTILAGLLQANAKKQHAATTETPQIFKTALLLLPIFILVQLFIHKLVPNELVNLPTERLVEGANISSASIRLHVWYDSLRLFFQSPWLGIGMGEMRMESSLLLDYPTSMASMRMFEHAHNLFLHLLAEMGIGAFLIVLTGTVIWMRNFKWRTLSLETWWLLSLLAVLGIHSMLEYPLWNAYFLGITAVLLGAGDNKPVLIHLPIDAKFTHKVLRPSLALFLLLGFINLGTLLIANVKLEKWVGQFRYESINEQKLIDWTYKYSILSPYADLLSVMSMPVNPTDINKKVLLSQSVMHFMPLRKVVYQHVLLLQLQGDDLNAKKQLNRALIAYGGNSKEILEFIPLQYRQDYMNLLSEVRPNE